MLSDIGQALTGIGKWRYLLTGLPLAVLFGLICRAFGRLLAPFGEWKRFRGICREVAVSGEQCAVSVQFADASRLQHNAAFCVTQREASAIKAGDSVCFYIRRERFLSGEYAEALSAAAENNGGFQLAAAHRAWIRDGLLRNALREILVCGVVAAVFLAAMHFCFP